MLATVAMAQNVNLHMPAPTEQPTGWDFTVRKMGGWAMFAAAGYAHGLTDAYHADNFVFEKAWGVDKYSFFGSAAWERNYSGNRYRSNDGGVNRHKPQLGNTFRDVWHGGNMAQKTLLIGGTFVIGTSPRQKLWHKLVDAGIGFALYSFASQQAYNIRYPKR